MTISSRPNITEDFLHQNKNVPLSSGRSKVVPNRKLKQSDPNKVKTGTKIRDGNEDSVPDIRNSYQKDPKVPVRSS